MGSLFDRGARRDHLRSGLGEQALAETFRALGTLGWTMANSGNDELSRYPRTAAEGATMTLIAIQSALVLETDPMVWKEGTLETPDLSTLPGAPFLPLGAPLVLVFSGGRWWSAAEEQ